MDPLINKEEKQFFSLKLAAKEATNSANSESINDKTAKILHIHHYQHFLLMQRMPRNKFKNACGKY